jgi:carbonic anhydrase/acetyltransferase-like protein (isoleucine patch superfamily)
MPAFAGMTGSIVAPPCLALHRNGMFALNRSARMPIYELDGIAPELPADGSYWVAESAVVIGKVRMKGHTSIWFGAVLRGDNEWIELGERSQIQDNATLHTDPGFPMTIGANCVIGHNVILHGCTIGDECLIGMGATVLDGANIGCGSIVGANSLVPQHFTCPPGSMVYGSPAKVIRPLKDAERAGLKPWAEKYVVVARAHAALHQPPD